MDARAVKITKSPDMALGSIDSGSSIGGVVIGPPAPPSGPGQGIVSSSSNAASWQPIVSTITSNGSNVLLGPNVNFSSGSNVTFSVSSNTLFIHANLGSGGASTRPPFDYVVAPSDSTAAMQATADAICDGTADEVQINAAITAAVAANRPYSIKLLPGTYEIASTISFQGLTSMGGKWVTFEASDTIIRAEASMTNMVDLAPGAGAQLITCLDLRLGMLHGNKASFSVTNVVKIARCNDNRIRINDITDGSGNAVLVDMAGVSDYPCGNNQFELNALHNMGGAAFYVTGGTNEFGFQGNVVRFGQVIANANGFVIGEAVNNNAIDNTFIGSPIEHNTNYGIRDECGKNIWIVNNTNSNTTAGLSCPTGMTYKSMFIGTFEDTIAAAVTDQHYIINAGDIGGITDFIERSSSAATPSSGKLRLYAKTDDKLYYKRDDGTEVEIGAPGASTLDELSDVVISGATLGDILRHNGTTWRNYAGHYEAVTDGVDVFVWEGLDLVHEWSI